MKQCSKCGKWKEESEFSKDKTKKSGLYSSCKQCVAIYNKIYLIEHREKINKYHNKWNHQNREACTKGFKEWRTKNRSRWNDTQREIHRKRRKNPKYRLNDSVSNGIRKSLKKNKNGKRWENIVDYTLKDLMKHLQEQFHEGMSWDNYGEWHIDHKIPVSVFNFEKVEDIDFKRCWALNNLQPLWADLNYSKGCSITKPFQPSLIFGGQHDTPNPTTI